ncbi:MAG: hypothetical protein KDK70_34520, partial [Myxococcales bacterium]|nr:hypothetical protein [Myxococcales bacterium]
TMEPTDDGTDQIGAWANLAPQDRVRFFDEGQTDAEQMGSGLQNANVICRDNALCDYSPNPGAATPGSLSSLFHQSSVGTWRLCVGDADPSIEGTIDYVALTIDQVSA